MFSHYKLHSVKLNSIIFMTRKNIYIIIFLHPYNTSTIIFGFKWAFGLGSEVRLDI